MAITVDIGVFAHNAAASIASMVAELARQDILVGTMDVRVLILAHGCIDATVDRARAACAATGDRIEVADLALGGKSRTWNSFVHDLSRPGSDILLFCDTGIEMPEADSLTRLVKALIARPELHVMGSRPVKDIAYRPQGLNRTERLIAIAGDHLGDWKPAICSQLYAMPAPAARALHLPIDLPLEDDFLRMMVLTDALTSPKNSARIDGDVTVFHLYPSERSMLALIRHRTHIMVGAAINAAIFNQIRSLPASARRAELSRAASEETWLSGQVKAQLPRLPYGYVPPRLLLKRSANALARPRELLRPSRIFLLFAGFGFDLIVYLNAQIRMVGSRGAGQ